MGCQIPMQMELIDQPSLWPCRPILPMKKAEKDGMLLGYLREQAGLTVFDYDTKRPIARFQSQDELWGSGWRVD